MSNMAKYCEHGRYLLPPTLEPLTSPSFSAGFTVSICIGSIDTKTAFECIIMSPAMEHTLNRENNYKYTNMALCLCLPISFKLSATSEKALFVLVDSVITENKLRTEEAQDVGEERNLRLLQGD